jgi:ribosomal protein L16 Arg81 hydroxylase
MNTNIHQKVIDDGWRRWIAENLMLGHSSDSIIKRMVEGGYDNVTAQKEVMSAVNHPYIHAGISFGRKIRKRDWILDNYRLLEQDSLTFGLVDRKHKLSREVFLRDYYTTNRPVIIQGAMENWAAINKWSPDWLKQHFGERVIEVQANRNADRLYEINMEKHRKQLLLGDFVDLITRNESTNDVYMTANNGSKNMEALKELWDDIDMLPEYLDGKSDRKGFLWFGPAGTITPLHHDLTNNFMAQIYGRKLIKLIPSYHMPYVYNHLHCYSEIDMGNIDYERYPLLKKANIMELILEPGEVLFLPVGCWHYVHGLDISMTMTFTNFLFNNDFSSNYTTYNEI